VLMFVARGSLEAGPMRVSVMRAPLAVLCTRLSLMEMEDRQSTLSRAIRESTNVPGTLPRFCHGFNDFSTRPE
jgi:hypothetical protein